MSDLRDKRIELILQQLEELPTLPAVAVRVLQATSDQSSSAADIVKLIGSDPALTTRILQLTRRADKAVRDDVQTIDRAVVLLGFDAVRNAVLAISIFQALGGSPAGGSPAGGPPTGASAVGAARGGKSEAAAASSNPAGFSREEFWKHCLAVACCAELLAEIGGRSGGVNPSDAFICGLLHDIGKLALDVALPKSFARVVEATEMLRGNIADLERTIIGVDHQIAGKRLAERWQLPAAVRDVAWLHGQSPAALPVAVHALLVNLVTLADLLVRQQHLGYSGNYTFAVSRPTLLAATGLNEKQAEQALAALVQRMEPRSAALGLGQTTSQALYREALAQANRELSRVGSQLIAKSRKLSQRTQFLDALHQFHTEIRSDASPQQVLCAVAATAAGVIGLEKVAAFSLAPAHDYAEAVLCDAAGTSLESALIELPGMSGLTESSPLTEEDLRATREMHEGGSLDMNGSADSVESAAAATAAPQASLPMSVAAVPSSISASYGQGTVLQTGDSIEWLTGTLSPKLSGGKRFWVCLAAEGACIGGIVWGADANEAERLAPQAQELGALAHGWALALRMAQVREASRSLAEELAEANRRLSAAQDVFLRTRALTTVGEMAAGAAHEMNNPLAVISGRSQLLARQLTDEKQQAAARLIHEQSDRLSDIITEMMAFAKPQPPVIRLSDATDLIYAAVIQAKDRSVAANRNIEVAGGPVPPVLVDAEQVSAALSEVIDNAIQATQADGGKITIQMAHDPWSARVVVDVLDNGCGMDETTLKRAFDPFYSSKPAGRRRGLGLAKALRWVEASGGLIRLESRPGQGTRAMLLLPAADKGSAVIEGNPMRVGSEPAASAADEERERQLTAGTTALR